MITEQILKDMKPGEIIATGTMVDGPLGINMTNSGKMLRWVAKRGDGMHDWCIYAHWEFQDVDWIIKSGDKVNRDATIKRLVPCDDDAFALYRR